jgi:exosortase K
MKMKLGVLAVVALVAYGLKRHYAVASTDALSWMLTPTAHFVGLVTGASFTAVPGEGYFSAERMFLIEKACAGVNFMIAAFVMVAGMLLHRVQSACSVGRVLFLGLGDLRAGAMVVGVSLLASYAAALVVNAVRIVIAMWLAEHPITVASLSAADIHRLEGITVYFAGLVLLYALVRRLDRAGGLTVSAAGETSTRVAWPLACYYVVTLAVPLANGAWRADAFLEHALVVLVLPVILILLVFGMQRLLSAYPWRSVSAGSSRQARHAGSHAAAVATTTSAPAPIR